MAKYVKALDYMICATQAYSQGKLDVAAKLLKAAAAHPSIKEAASLIDSYNDRQLAQARLEIAAKKKKAAPKKKARANAGWPFLVESSTGPDTPAGDDLDELGIEVDTNDGLREVQEADVLEGDEPELELEDIDTLDATAEGEEGDDDEGGEGEEPGEEEDVEQARFIRALHNSRAQKTAAKRLSTKK